MTPKYRPGFTLVEAPVQCGGGVPPIFVAKSLIFRPPLLAQAKKISRGVGREKFQQFFCASHWFLTPFVSTRNKISRKGVETEDFRQFFMQLTYFSTPFVGTQKISRRVGTDNFRKKLQLTHFRAPLSAHAKKFREGKGWGFSKKLCNSIIFQSPLSAHAKNFRGGRNGRFSTIFSPSHSFFDPLYRHRQKNFEKNNFVGQA